MSERRVIAVEGKISKIVERLEIFQSLPREALSVEFLFNSINMLLDGFEMRMLRDPIKPPPPKGMDAYRHDVERP